MEGWYILGTGHFALEVLEWACDAGLSRSKLQGFLGQSKDAPALQTGFPCLDEGSAELNERTPIVNAISTPGVKQKVCESIKAKGGSFHTVVHPTAVVKTNEIGAGTVVCPNCVVGPFAEIGELVTLNYHTGVGHETKVGDYVSTAPGVQIGGNSMIGSGSYFGMNSAVIDKVKVGADVTASVGSVIIGRISDGQRVAGNPAKRSRVF
ncbi:MAG: hypothetical protein AB8B50_18855 [Pirellulaceae bacterium]